MRDTQAGGESGAVEQRARSHLLAIENALFDVLVCFLIYFGFIRIILLTNNIVLMFVFS